MPVEPLPQWRPFLGNIAGSLMREKDCPTQPVEEHDRSYCGFNLFDPKDDERFGLLARGEFGRLPPPESHQIRQRTKPS